MCKKCVSLEAPLPEETVKIAREAQNSTENSVSLSVSVAKQHIENPVIILNSGANL